MTEEDAALDPSQKSGTLLEELESLEGTDLEARVRKLLGTRPTVTDEHPYLRLVDAYRHASRALDQRLQQRLSLVLRGLLEEAVEQPWDLLSPQTANLLATAQHCPEHLAAKAFELADRLEPDTEDEQDLLAGLLKILIAQQDTHRGTVDFWLAQKQKLAPSYGALIFSGLVLHGLSRAMKHLPELSADPTAAHWIALFLPVLVDLFGGEETVALALAEQEPLLTAEGRRSLSPFVDRAMEVSNRVLLQRLMVADPQTESEVRQLATWLVEGLVRTPETACHLLVQLAGNARVFGDIVDLIDRHRGRIDPSHVAGPVERFVARRISKRQEVRLRESLGLLFDTEGTHGELYAGEEAGERRLVRA